VSEPNKVATRVSGFPDNQSEAGLCDRGSQGPTQETKHTHSIHACRCRTVLRCVATQRGQVPRAAKAG
jgi:hypothetical protein